MLGFVKEYLDAGWEAPFPLEYGQKYPPTPGVTGRIPDVSRQHIESIWSDRDEPLNLGIRMQVSGQYDVISIDVDHYGTKQGRDFLEEMMKELGDLNLDEIPRSTRRGARSRSAQYFFRVPKGVEWEARACADVDVVQKTHRYSAVWPSVVDGEQYKWYIGLEESEIPHVNDLPILPERWVRHLTRGKKGRSSSTRKPIGGFRQSIEWLRDNIPGWDVADEEMDDPDVAMSAYMRDASSSDQFIEDLKGNAHDSMISAIHSCIMLAIEGHHGLKAALYHIRKNFLNEVLGDSRRTPEDAKSEYERAVIGEIEKVAADVEAGTVRILDVNDSLAMPDFFQLFVTSESGKRPLGVDWREYGNTDQGHARMFKDYWGNDVLVTDDNRNQEFAAWLPKTGRYSFRNLNQMFRFVEVSVSAPLEYEAGKMDELAQATAEREAEGQLGAEEMDSDQIKGIAKNLYARANSLRNTRPAQSMLKQLHSFDDLSVNLDEFDSVPGKIGAKNGKTLDLMALRNGEDPIRDSTKADMLTMTTAVSVQPGSTHKKWNEFLDKFIPDKEIQRFAQKVFGYCLVDHNPSKLLVFLWGPSNTGKTTILEAIARALGDYSAPMSAHKIFGNSNMSTNPELVSAIKKRMVILSEVGDGYKLSSNAIKQITGNDLQQARNNHSNHIVNAVPMFTPYVSTNSPPEISRGDAALKNRILVLPFNEEHPPQKNISPEEDLKENKEIQSAILWWLVEGCKMYFEEGLTRNTWPEKVKNLSEDFILGTSTFQQFLSEHLEIDPKARERVSDVFAEWKRWCSRKGVLEKEVGSERNLHSILEANGFKVTKNTSHGGKKNITVVDGIKIPA